MLKRLGLLLSISLLLAGIISVNSVRAATDYSGGLLDGKVVNRGHGPLTHQYLGSSFALTDNNESTSVTLEAGSSNLTNMDGLIFDFDTPVDLLGYRFKIASKSGVHIVFYKNDGTSIDVLENQLVVDGSYKSINYQDVVKIHIHQAWNTTNNKEVYEFNVYGLPAAPLNTAATAIDKSILVEWNPVDNVQKYVIKRAINAGGPYEIVASNVTDTNYVDTNVDYGITYYYVITATNPAGESMNSNEASATPTATPIFGRSLLTVYISGGQIKEYDLSAAELNAYLNWYDAKDAGSGPAKYAFTKTWNKGPFKTRTEYIIFDKILTFDVDEYEVENP